VVLVDTSVWIDHFRNGNARLIEILNNDNVYCHPLIIGELACGNLKNRNDILLLLKSLPQAKPVDHDELLLFIDSQKLMGQGVGYVDISLLGSALIAGLSLWTFDKKLQKLADRFNICY